MIDAAGRPGRGDARVLVVDDQGLFAQSLVMALQLEGVRAERASDVDEAAVLADAERVRPHVVLLGYQLGPDEHVALPLIAPLRERGAAVVVVTGAPDRVRLAECIEAGALSVVGTSDALERLVDAIDEALQGRSLLGRNQREAMLAELSQHRLAEVERKRPFASLTRRESEVLAGLLRGHSADEIAAEQFVSTATVRSQIHTLLGKLGVGSALGAVAMAREAGWRPD